LHSQQAPALRRPYHPPASVPARALTGTRPAIWRTPGRRPPRLIISATETRSPSARETETDTLPLTREADVSAVAE
jgi:hypothetical protein